MHRDSFNRIMEEARQVQKCDSGTDQNEACIRAAEDAASSAHRLQLQGTIWRTSYQLQAAEEAEAGINDMEEANSSPRPSPFVQACTFIHECSDSVMIGPCALNTFGLSAFYNFSQHLMCVSQPGKGEETSGSTEADNADSKERAIQPVSAAALLVADVAARTFCLTIFWVTLVFTIVCCNIALCTVLLHRQASRT